MKKLLFTLLILGQIIMAATIQHLNINNTEIPIIYEHDKRLPLAVMQLIFTDSGSIADEKKAGLAKFSARVMNEGTKKLGSSAFADQLEAKAIHISSSVGTETFVINISSLTDEFDNALKYLDDLLQDPNFTKETIQKVKTTTIGSLSRKENDFDYVASNELKALLFENSVLAQPSAGTIESVKSIDLRDVEEFVKTHLVSSRLIVAVGGDVDIQELKPKLEKLVAHMAVGENSDVKNYAVRSTPKEKVLLKDTKQAYIYFGSPFYMKESDPEYYKARVAMFILGSGGFGSRLMEEIRVKRGLAYSAYGRVNVSKSSSYFSGYLQTKLDSLEQAKKTVNDVIAKFVKNGVSKEELEQTKKFLLGSEPLRVETMNQRLHRTFMEFYKGVEIGYSQKELEKIKALKLKDLNSFIKKHTEILDLSYAIIKK